MRTIKFVFSWGLSDNGGRFTRVRTSVIFKHIVYIYLAGIYMLNGDFNGIFGDIARL